LLELTADRPVLCSSGAVVVLQPLGDRGEQQTPESIQLLVNLRAAVRREGKHWVAGCPALDVWTQGKTRQDAQQCLNEAVPLWFEDCLARGTLDRALQEVGFRPVPLGVSLSGGAQTVHIMKSAADEGILGSAFDVTVSIPAYQAAASNPQGIVNDREKGLRMRIKGLPQRGIRGDRF
jgi:predicted RNase H-like HicB family nuclease